MADIWHIDYSATQLDGKTIARTQVGPKGEYATGAIRYIDDISNPALVRTKHVTRAEYASLKTAGIAMDAMYMEVGVDDPLGGYPAGQVNARRAQAGMNYLGWQGKVLFCCDRWFTSKGHVTISAKSWQDYLDGAVSVLGRTVAGGYGFADAIDAARGHVDFAVQCGSRSAVRSWVNGWQDNNIQPKVGGISTDRVLILNAFGPGVPSAPASQLTQAGVEIMERITVTPPNAEQNTVRVNLSGSAGAAIVVRPRIDGTGFSKPMWIGDIFAWGNDHNGIGHNPTQIPGYNSRLTSHRRYDLPGGVWADINYSAAEPFEIDIVG
jgi:hypothetical protein